MTSFAIGCAGRARHGKGTTAEVIKTWADSVGVKSQIISFADPLKDFLTLLIGRSEPFRGNSVERAAPVTEMPWNRLSESILVQARLSWPNQDFNVAPTGRQLMQLFGTNTVRYNFCPDAWVIMAGNRANKFDGLTIVDDVRFTNEARPKHLFPVLGVFDAVLKIVRPDEPKLSHPSEDAVDDIPMDWFDGVFINTADMASLQSQVLAWLERTMSVHGGTIKIAGENDARGSLGNHTRPE